MRHKLPLLTDMNLPRFDIAHFWWMAHCLKLGLLKLPLWGKWWTMVRLRWVFPLPVMKRHCLLIGKTGSGKSELLKLLVLRLKRPLLPFAGVSTRRTVVLIDPHGDLARECARQKTFLTDYTRGRHTRQVPNLVYIAPGKQGATPVLNPFDVCGQELTRNEIDVRAQFLGSAFTTMLSKGDVTLSLPMKTTLIPMITVLLSLGQHTGQKPLTFIDLERFLDDDRNADLVTHGCQLPGWTASFFQRTFPSKRLQPTKFALRLKLANLLQSSQFVRLLAQPRSSWNLDSLIKGGYTILVECPRSILGNEVSEIYGRTIVAMIQSAVFCRQGKRMPVYLFLDEAASFIGEDIKTVLAEARKFGLHLCLSYQVARQGSMSRDFHDNLMGNTALKVVGNAGYNTRQTMAKECDTSAEALENLPVGAFIVKSGKHRPLRIRIPKTFLGNRQVVSTERFMSVLADQKCRYYHSESEPAPVSEHGRLALELQQRGSTSRLPRNPRPQATPHF